MDILFDYHLIKGCQGPGNPLRLAVDELKRCYPDRSLPHPGEALWRRFFTRWRQTTPEQMGDEEESVPSALIEEIIEAARAFAEWLKDYYRLDDQAPAEQVQLGHDRDALRVQGAGHVAVTIDPRDEADAPPTSDAGYGPTSEKSGRKRPVVRLAGEGMSPTVFGIQVKPLGPSQYCIVEALLRAGRRGLTTSELFEKSGVPDPVGCIKRIRKRDELWAKAIIMAGEAWSGGYRIALG